MPFVSTPLQNTLNLPTRVAFAGNHRRAENVRPHAHACAELILINQGACDIHLNGGSIHADTNDLIAMPAHHVHDQQSDDYIDTLFCGFVAAQAASWNQPRVVSLRDAGFIRQCMQLLASIYGSREIQASTEAASAVLQAILEQVHQHEREHHEANHIPARLVTAMRYIENHIADPITIDSLAEHTRMSTSNLHVLFRKHLDTTPIRYLQDQRMQAARTALLTPYLSVKEVATICGYSDVNYFVRAFRQCHDSPPGRWRAEQLQSLEFLS